VVAVQLPVYNERYVAERSIDAAAGLDWPRDRLQVQVLDDSDDDTPSTVDRTAARWRAEGVDVRHLRRGTRAGFKAGALAYGLEHTDAEFVAVFDADFATSCAEPCLTSSSRMSASSRPAGGTSTSATRSSRACRR
jgi:cellulose synthase/poly-beta-1,6-N-acetylglucosamine synthase-like glycosyltransferase